MNNIRLSEKFDINDIRTIREYNSLRHINMTSKEIVEDTRKGAADLLGKMKEGLSSKV